MFLAFELLRDLTVDPALSTSSLPLPKRPKEKKPKPIIEAKPPIFKPPLEFKVKFQESKKTEASPIEFVSKYHILFHEWFLFHLFSLIPMHEWGKLMMVFEF